MAISPAVILFDMIWFRLHIDSTSRAYEYLRGGNGYLISTETGTVVIQIRQILISTELSDEMATKWDTHQVFDVFRFLWMSSFHSFYSRIFSTPTSLPEFRGIQDIHY